MKKHVVFSLLIAMAVLSISCDRQTISRLDEIESYIQERPDSALTAIRNVDRTLLHSREGKAKYSLLEAMALDKNYIDTMDVNVIMPAVEYYRKHGTPDEKLKSLYYLTVIQYNGAYYSDAVVTYTEALPIIDQCEDKKYCGLMCRAIASLLNESYEDSEAINYLSRAAKYFHDGNYTDYEIETLCSIIQDYINIHQFEDAYSIIEDIYNLKPEGYLKYKSDALEAYLCMRLHKKDNKSIANSFSSSAKSGYKLTAAQLSAYAFVLNAIGEEDASHKIFDYLDSSADSQSKIDVIYWKSLIEEADGNLKLALEYKDEFNQKRDSLLLEVLKQSNAKAQRNYFETKAAENATEIKNQRLLFYLVLSLLIATVSVGYTVLRKKADVQEQKTAYFAELAETVKQQLKDSESARRMVAADYNELTAESQELKKQLEEREHTMALLRAEYSHMYKEKFNYLGELCETYFRYEDSGESQKRHVYEKVEEMLADIRDDVKGQARFEKMIDANLNNIMKRFREDFPKYSEEDYRFISYVFVGFDATTLLSIFHMPSQASVYCKKARIKSNIQKSNSKYKSYFLEMFA